MGCRLAAKVTIHKPPSYAQNPRLSCHQNRGGESDGQMFSAIKHEIAQPALRAVEGPTQPAWLTEALAALTTHWPEYLIEAACLGLFMLSACSFTVLLHHPGSVVRQMLPSVFLRRLATGIAMGLTAVAIIYS